MQFACYQVKNDHRKASCSTVKSQWTSTPWEEISLFTLAQVSGWKTLNKDELWAVHSVSGKPSSMGTFAGSHLFVARYVCSEAVWHGYPVLPLQFDKPPNDVLQKWKADGLIPNAVFNKWVQGKL